MPKDKKVDKADLAVIIGGLDPKQKMKGNNKESEESDELSEEKLMLGNVVFDALKEGDVDTFTQALRDFVYACKK